MNVFKLQVYTEIKCLYNCDGMNERKVNIFLLSIYDTWLPLFDGFWLHLHLFESILSARGYKIVKI